MYSKDLEITLDLNKKDIATNVLITTGGTDDHNKLENRDIENQHPISAITGLSETLENKQDKGDYALKSDIPDTTNLATKMELQNGLSNKQDKGDYALKSEIPTNNNQLTNGAGYITADYHDDTKQDVINDLNAIRQGAELGSTALQSVPDEYVTETELNAKGYLTSYTETDPVYTADKPNLALKSEIPTKVSSLTNDANYQTATDVASMIASIPQFKLSIVDELPLVGEKMTLYLVPKEGTNNDVYDEYIWIEQTTSFEHLGTTAVDLTDYVKNTDYATTSNGGVVKISDVFGTRLNNGFLYADILRANEYDRYSGSSFLSKGTLENIKENLVTSIGDTKYVAQDSLLEKTTETWTFTLEDGTEVTKTMVLGA